MPVKLMKQNKGWQPLGRLFASWIFGLIPYRHRYCTYLYYLSSGQNLHACQKSSGVRQNTLTQDVKTCCRSTHAMTESLHVNQEPLLVYEVRNAKLANGFNNNRLSLEDWSINNQSVALLTPLANASQYLEGKNYPTSNLVIPSMYWCIELLHPDAAVRQPWDCNIGFVSVRTIKGRSIDWWEAGLVWWHGASLADWDIDGAQELLLHSYNLRPSSEGLTFSSVSQEERCTRGSTRTRHSQSHKVRCWVRIGLEYKCPRRAVGACACTFSLGHSPCACACTCCLGLARLVRGLHGKYSTPPSTSGCLGVKGQVRGASLPGADYSSNEYRPTRVVGCKRDQLPSVECYGAAVPRCPGHVRLSWSSLQPRRTRIRRLAPEDEGGDAWDIHVVTYQQRKTSEGLMMPPPLRSRSCCVVDISDIVIISVIPDMVKGIISGITNLTVPLSTNDFDRSSFYCSYRNKT